MAEKPNIVLIMTDQQRADFLRSAGFPLDTMPFVDSLSGEGTRFSRAYTPMPICGPARCSTFTGRFPKATRVRENAGTNAIFRPTDLVEVLRERGYSINLAGKNHSYLRPEDFDFFSPYMHVGGGRPELRTPQQAQFDEWLGSLNQGTLPPPNQVVGTEPTPFPLECQLPYRVVSDAIECASQQDSRPFFLWLSFAEPHNPYQVPEPYFSLFSKCDVPERAAGPEVSEARGGDWLWLRNLIESKHPGYDELWRRYRANYCGMLRLIDDQIKRFVEHLDSVGQRENTLFVFCSDHGDYAGDYGLQRKGVGLPECLVRIPFSFTGPGVRQREAAEFVSLVDLMPTICEMLGAEIPYGVQGRSLWPMLTGGEYPKAEFDSIYSELGFGGLPYGADERPKLHFPYEGPRFDELNTVTQSGNLKMVRKSKWKLLFDLLGRGELYDVESDPAELRDLYDEPSCRDVRLELTEELLRWSIRTEDDLPSARYVPKRAEHNWQAPYGPSEEPASTSALGEASTQEER